MGPTSRLSKPRNSAWVRLWNWSLNSPSSEVNSRPSPKAILPGCRLGLRSRLPGDFDSSACSLREVTPDRPGPASRRRWRPAAGSDTSVHQSLPPRHRSGPSAIGTAWVGPPGGPRPRPDSHGRPRPRCRRASSPLAGRCRCARRSPRRPPRFATGQPRGAAASTPPALAPLPGPPRRADRRADARACRPSGERRARPNPPGSASASEATRARLAPARSPPSAQVVVSLHQAVVPLLDAAVARLHPEIRLLHPARRLLVEGPLAGAPTAAGAAPRGATTGGRPGDDAGRAALGVASPGLRWPAPPIPPVAATAVKGGGMAAPRGRPWAATRPAQMRMTPPGQQGSSISARP